MAATWGAHGEPASPGQTAAPDGVYIAGVAIDGGRALLAIVNLGTSPTFGPGERRLEVHFLDFEADLYGGGWCLFECHWCYEHSFPTLRSAQKQIGLDIARAERDFWGL